MLASGPGSMDFGSTAGSIRVSFWYTGLMIILILCWNLVQVILDLVPGVVILDLACRLA